MNESQTAWESMTTEEKKQELFRRQKRTLDLFLERNAISKVQYDKSLGDLIEKWVLRNTNGKSPTSVGLFLFWRFVDNFSDLHKHYISRT